jgi:hypothetical protein
LAQTAIRFLRNCINDPLHVGPLTFFIEDSDKCSSYSSYLAKYTNLTPTASSRDAHIAFLVANPDKLAELEKFLHDNDMCLYVCLDIHSLVRRTTTYSLFENHGFRLTYEDTDVCLFHRHQIRPKPLDVQMSLESPKIQHALGSSMRHLRNLPLSTRAVSCLYHGSDLLTPERFDIALKTIYARYARDGLASKWAEQVYYEHLVRVTGPGQEIAEYDGTGKSGFSSYCETFQSLLSPLDYNLIPAVPIDQSRVAFDGAHRIAAAIVTNRPIRAVQIDSPTPNPCYAPVSFFATRQNRHPPCDPQIIDEGVIEYVRSKPGTAIALIFPVVGSPQIATDQLKTIGKIVCQKVIPFTRQMGACLLHQVYNGHPWMDAQKNLPGFKSKVNSCFPFPGLLLALLIDEFDVSQLRETKERIRNAYGLGNHSIHVTDTDDETLRTAQILFNANSLDLLKANISPTPGFLKNLINYKTWMDTHDLDPNLFALDGSALLGLLGLREPRDLDFLSMQEADVLPATPDLVSCHNEAAAYHLSSIADILGDPRLHAWYMGVKFCAPAVIMSMKRRRGEEKDRNDIGLLRTKIHGTSSPFYRMIRRTSSTLSGAWGRGFSGLIEICKRPLRPHVHRYRTWRTKRKTEN